MPTTTKTKTTDETREQELLRTHRELVAMYSVKSGAERAQVSRKINLIQIELDLLGVDFPFWVKPTATVTRSWTHTPDELLARIEGLRKLVAREDRPEAHRAAADKALSDAIEQATKRGIEVPEVK